LASISIGRSRAEAEPLVWRAVGACERGTALALLVATGPVLAAAAAAIAVLSRRAPVIAHRRVGYLGSTLWMLKLRTMWDGGGPTGGGWVEFIEDDAGPGAKSASDSRVTSRFAAFCRRHSIDELPQLWHVVRGEMALIGPRPLTAREIAAYYGDDAGEVLSVKPGIAGLWQTSGRNRLTYAERRRFDLAFVRGRSLGMYLRILARVFPEIWTGANTW
jgi:exopolysaccharide production protein ExoY